MAIPVAADAVVGVSADWDFTLTAGSALDAG
jgi:hypothetical protein